MSSRLGAYSYEKFASAPIYALSHEHISKLWWVKVENGKETTLGESTREAMVEFIEKNGPTIVWCPDMKPNGKNALVHVHSNERIKYVQTVADDRKTDNLLSLPEK